MFRTIRISVIFILLFLGGYVNAQNGKIDTVKIVNGGDYLSNGFRDSVRYIKFVGSADNRVVFKQKETEIFCDSAYLFKSLNRVEAFSNVKVLHQDTITVTGQKLTYEGNIKLARMTFDARYRDPSLTITSDTLQYDMLNNIASYYHNGKLKDTRNTLTSEIGTYQTNIKLASFKNDVVLINPEYTLYSDTLQYNTASKVAIFRGPTKIVSQKDSTIINAQAGGKYVTTAKQTTFGKGQIETPTYILEADELFSDELNQFYSATNNVKLISKKENLVITGEFGRYWKGQGLTKIFGDPVMEKAVDNDTLFLSADTLVSIESKIAEKERLLAYQQVKIYKSDLQGIADSIAYHLADSVIYMYFDPVLWHTNTQIEADSINIMVTEKGIDQLHMSTNSFLITQDTLKNPNQIKGRKMIAYFKDNQLDRLNIYGNGESLLYALNDQETNIIGINKVLCSNIVIRFENSAFEDASFYVKPEAKFIPPHEVQGPDRRLKGFNWREGERPDKSVVFRMEKPGLKEVEIEEEIKAEKQEGVPVNIPPEKNNLIN